MKLKILILSLFMFFGILVNNAQTIPDYCDAHPDEPRCKKVVTTQGVLDDSNKAFQLVVAQRDTINSLLELKNISDAERTTYKAAKVALEDVISIMSKIDDARKLLIETYDKIIKIQDDIINKLTTQINKKKSTFEKILSVLKRVGDVLLGVTIGRIIN